MHFEIQPRRAAKRNQTGAANATWKGGRIKQGEYVYVKAPDHPKATKSGYVAEHVLVATVKEGRSPSVGEVVHHINMRKHDNDPANLVILTRIKHAAFHRQMENIVGSLFREGILTFDPDDGYSVNDTFQLRL